MENKLKELRLQSKVSQSTLADALSVSRQTINSIENGKFDPSLTLAMKLTRFFKVSLDEIFIYKD
ncbi:helix-turn-helix transcriptional regulator [Gammaproteobacteria bacterium]|nr:helix-turn-helix transcriptional regulator [Gammaproteobacteria bacterium]MDA7821539.1 helix-turn-helix transcriptional regulator [Gammaproteobacteria bacterium]MDA9046068.1 helix-turn-helix transcriptional regulator [Gammaproteobacteria bacterium]MDA9220330.1 helix-turn-helix transcriptional regulator [Gammaproteobacteria bacterium]MDB3915944.1 helix-turn-helix transcriptional regulator [Gammaproteobacteria bacterium]